MYLGYYKTEVELDINASAPRINVCFDICEGEPSKIITAYFLKEIKGEDFEVEIPQLFLDKYEADIMGEVNDNFHEGFFDK